MKSIYIIFIFLFAIAPLRAQDIPTKKVISIDNLSEFLKEDVKKEIASGGEISETALAEYFREKFAERYFYNWKNFD